ncbi:MAG: leucine-rich repeat domain-containing protein [Promethearchaeota archaeon]
MTSQPIGNKKIINEFRINDFLTLRLEKSNNSFKTNIYVKDQLFVQCKYLLLSIPYERVISFAEIESVDEASERLSHTMQDQPKKGSIVPPKIEFWGHCSNLQVWYENGYDTRLIHSNLAFPLLKELARAGDPLARKVFQEEIAKRLETGYLPVVSFLVIEDYLKYLPKNYFQELDNYTASKLIEVLFTGLSNSQHRLTALYLFQHLSKNMSKKEVKKFIKIVKESKDLVHYIFHEPGMLSPEPLIHVNSQRYSQFTRAYAINELKGKKFYEIDSYYLSFLSMHDIACLGLDLELIYDEWELREKRLCDFSDPIEKFQNGLYDKSLVYTFRDKKFKLTHNRLSLINLQIKNISEIQNLDKLTQLRVLNLSHNHLTEIKGLDELKELRELYLNVNSISKITGLENFEKLEVLWLSKNKIKEISGLENCANLEFLWLSDNIISEIKGLDKLTKLRDLNLNKNQLTEIKGLEKLINLRDLSLSENSITVIENLDKLQNLKRLYLNGNQISEIKGLKNLSNLKILSLHGNQISEIRNFNLFETLPNLNEVSLRNNPLTKNTIEQLKKKKSKIKYWFPL